MSEDAHEILNGKVIVHSDGSSHPKWVKCTLCEDWAKPTSQSGQIAQTSKGTPIPHDCTCEVCGASIDQAKPVPETACHNCKFWDHIEENKGFCNRYPPVVIWVAADNPDERGITGFRRPRTEEMDWCGEFQPKAKDENLPR